MIQNKAFFIVKRRLVHLRYKDGCSMSEHMNDFQDIVNRLSNLLCYRMSCKHVCFWVPCLTVGILWLWHSQIPLQRVCCL